jgi:hypothetical protein
VDGASGGFGRKDAMSLREETAWPKGPYYWNEGDTQYISVPFTFNLPEVRQEILDGHLFARRIVVGGPAVQMMPEYLADIADIGADYPGVLQMVNPLATRTTLGCVRSCGFCGIGRGCIEPGGYRELEDWPDNPIICDNNLLAASTAHFDKVVDRLKHHKGVDFNQGLDARLLTDHHARRLVELDATIRLAWDHIGEEKALLTAVTRLRRAGVPRKRLSCYVLIGFKDTPADALYRIETLYFALGITTNVMRYVPLDSLTRHHAEPGWTDKDLTRMSRWGNSCRVMAKVPFEEFE